MALKKLIKKFRFVEENRSKLILGNGVRLDPAGFLELEVDSSGDFLTTADLSAKTWVTLPKTSKQWIGFESRHVTPLDFQNNAVTSVNFRLSRDGLEEVYWDGAAWSAAGPGDWNTEEEIADNIADLALSAGARSFQVIMNLETSDPELSPRVYFVKALYESDLESPLEDIVARSLVPDLKLKLRPIAEAAYASDGTTSQALTLTGQYDVIGIDAVYDLTADSDRLTNLFDSFAGGVITLTSAPTAGNILLVRFSYRPDVVIERSQDVTELAKIPAVVIEDVRSSRTEEITCHESVIDKANSTGWRLTGGEQIDFAMTIRIETGKEKDLDRLSDEVRDYFSSNPLLRRVGVDEDVRLDVIGDHETLTQASASGVHTAKIRAAILGAVFYRGQAEQVSSVSSFQVTGDLSVNVP